MVARELIFIVGPTASGKSSLALDVAKQLNGEIICADSQTIRRDLNIGTAKPTPEERAEIPHHLLDIIEPFERFSAAAFKELAEAAIEDIYTRGKLPIIVGGTGLYIDALMYDFSFRQEALPSLRKKLEAMTIERLQEEIEKKELPMPTNMRNPRHLIRTIESAGLVGLKKALRKDAIVVGLDPGVDVLHDRIVSRVDAMLRDGLINEVKAVLKKYGSPPANWDAIGYQIVLQNMDGKGNIDSEYVRNSLIIAHRQYAKRQRSWFKRNRDIQWFEQSKNALSFIKKSLHNLS